MLATPRSTRSALVAGALVTAVFVLGGQVPTYAGDPWGDVDCQQEPDHPVCSVEAGSSAGVMVAGPGVDLDAR